jgi:molecular chaperone DnaK (HSP70)
MEVFLGIDLGTTTTLVGSAIEGDKAISVRVLPIRQDKIELLYLPSVAYFPLDRDPLVGLAARALGTGYDPSRYVRAVKRQMGRRILLPVVEREPYEVSSLYLAYALREARHRLPVADTVFTATVPASFTTNQRADTLLALRKACDEVGLSYPKQDEGELFISEPVAAMLAFLNQELARPAPVRRLDLSDTRRVVVYDIGGGTLDLTMVFVEPQNVPVQSLADLRVHVDTIGYYNPFGGEDFDLALAKKVLHPRLLEENPELREVVLTPNQRLGVRLQLMIVAQGIKEKLSEQMRKQADAGFLPDSSEESSLYYTGKVRIPQEQEMYSLEGEITEADYRECVGNLLTNDSRKSLVTPLRDLLHKTRFDPADLDGLLIVGGMGRLPLVTETVKAYWGNDRAWVFDPPDHAVVTGAAIYSYLRRRYPDFDLEEPAADGYYVRLKEKFDLILPTRAKEGEQREYKLPTDADRIILQIFAGEEPEGGQAIETIYPTLIHQGGTTIDLKREYPKNTPVWVQMRYVGDDSSKQDHSKVPWIYVWVESNQGEPLFRLRYSELVKEVRRE